MTCELAGNSQKSVTCPWARETLGNDPNWVREAAGGEEKNNRRHVLPVRLSLEWRPPFTGTLTLLFVICHLLMWTQLLTWLHLKIVIVTVLMGILFQEVSQFIARPFFSKPWCRYISSSVHAARLGGLRKPDRLVCELLVSHSTRIMPLAVIYYTFCYLVRHSRSKTWKICASLGNWRGEEGNMSWWAVSRIMTCKCPSQGKFIAY